MITRLSDIEYIKLLEKENKYLRNKIKEIEEQQAKKLEKDFQKTQKNIGNILSVLVNKL